MSTDHPDPSSAEHPWRGIALDVYEQHMGDARVTQLQRLHDITAEQLAAPRFGNSSSAMRLRRSQQALGRPCSAG